MCLIIICPPPHTNLNYQCCAYSYSNLHWAPLPHDGRNDYTDPCLLRSSNRYQHANRHSSKNGLFHPLLAATTRGKLRATQLGADRSFLFWLSWNKSGDVLGFAVISALLFWRKTRSITFFLKYSDNDLTGSPTSLHSYMYIILVMAPMSREYSTGWWPLQVPCHIHRWLCEG